MLCETKTTFPVAVPDAPGASNVTFIEPERSQVTLHNMALAASEEDAAGCFSRLHHLLTSNCFPAEAFSNLLLLYCSPQHALYDAAADLMAQNQELVESSISKVSQPSLALMAAGNCCG